MDDLLDFDAKLFEKLELRLDDRLGLRGIESCGPYRLAPSRRPMCKFFLCLAQQQARTSKIFGAVLLPSDDLVTRNVNALRHLNDLLRQAADARADLEEAQMERARALGRLGPLFTAAATEDRDALREAIGRSDSRRTLEVDLERHRSEILKAGGGSPLEQLLGECEEADAATLGARARELEEEIGAHSNAIAELSGELATARADFKRLDAGPDAALAAADAEIARAEMAEQAEA